MKFSKGEKIKMFQPGDKVVVMGSSPLDREMFTYQDPVSFVTEISKSDDQVSGSNSNQEFMRRVAILLKETDVTIPHHNEEAFINALIRAGICSRASLN